MMKGDGARPLKNAAYKRGAILIELRVGLFDIFANNQSICVLFFNFNFFRLVGLVLV